MFGASVLTVEVNLRQSVGQSVLVSGTHLGLGDQFFFLLEISFRLLRVCYFVAPSLTRVQVCNLLYNCFWALPEQSLLSEVPQNSRPYFTVSSETPPTWRARSPYLFPPRNRVTQLYPRALGSLFVASYDSQGLRWRYSNPPPHGVVVTVCNPFLCEGVFA
jgi:hypothetical protein